MTLPARERLARWSALLLLPGACDAAPTTRMADASVTSPTGPTTVAGPTAGTIDCPADADTPTRLECAEDAVAKAVADTPGQAAFMTFLTTLRERYEVEPLGERVAQVNAAARFAQQRRAALDGGVTGAAADAASTPGRDLPRALDDGWQRARIASCPVGPAADACRSGLDAALSRYLSVVGAPSVAAADADPTPAATGAPMADAPMIDGRPVPDCRSLDTGDAAAIFERGYPAALVDPARVDAVVIPKASLSVLVAFITCAAARTNYEPFVIDQVRALFESRRHGGPAMAALDAAAAGTTQDGAAARTFRDVIKPQLGRDGNG